MMQADGADGLFEDYGQERMPQANRCTVPGDEKGET